MTEVQVFEFSPFAENTYVVFDDSGECIVVDPGCYTKAEEDELKYFILERDLMPVRLLNTHCHLDHVFGNRFVAETWDIGLEIHRGEQRLLEMFPATCKMYGIPWTQPSPMPAAYLEAGQTIRFGHTRLKALWTPGHSPASLSFYCEESSFVLAGDVLFWESIGRTDLPGGDTATLLASIRRELFVLPDETMVYPGHGPSTTIRHEKSYNPFLS
jgi:hydroxyacylglutathione hydrolase